MITIPDKIHEEVNKKNPKLVGLAYIGLIEFLYKQFLLSILAEGVIIVFIAFIFWKVTPVTNMLYWLSYCLLISASFRLSLLASYTAHKDRLSMDNWKRLYVFSAFLSGISWGLAVVLLLPTANLGHHSIFIIVTTGVAFAGLHMNSAIPAAYFFFLFASTLPLMIWCFMHGGIYIFVGICSIFFDLAMIQNSISIHRLLFKSLLLRFQNSNLDLENTSLEEEAQKRHNEFLKSLALFESALDSIEDQVMVLHLDSTIRYYSKNILTLWSIPQKAMATLFHAKNRHLILDQLVDPEAFIKNHALDNLRSAKETYDEITLKNGKVFECYSKPYILDTHILGRILGFRDISARKRMEEKISYQATHDTLTKLANRGVLYDRLEYNINYNSRYKTKLAVLFIDLDNFREVNDSLGHHTGDKIIRIVSQRLLCCVRRSDTVARLDSDEFVILFNLNQRDDIDIFCKKILNTISQPIRADDEELIITASIGASIYPDNGDESDILLKNADLALFMAKKKGRGQLQLFNSELNQQLQRRQVIQQQLALALENEEFFLVYLPVLDLHTNRCSSAEALIRWNNPVLGLVPPDEFLPIAEESALIDDMNAWIIRSIYLQKKAWEAQDLQQITISVNISNTALKKDYLLTLIESMQQETGLSSEYLEIEVTENALMDTSKKTIDMLNALVKKGIRIAIDNFGSGYSSLRHLKEFTASKLKIDKAFIEGPVLSTSNQSILHAIITMGHELNLRILADGVESNDVLSALRENQCDEIQGNIYSRPLTPSEMTSFLRSGK